MPFDNIEYLRSGNSRQRQAYRVLTRHGVFQKLEPYTPLLAGTIPIEIDIAISDLDIICHCTDLQEFSSALNTHFHACPGFSLRQKSKQGHACVIANFKLEDFPIEIFGQDMPSKQQPAYRHMCIEHRILQERGEAFRQQVIALKKQGIKTEPAFGMLLGLTGDPYLELLGFDSEPL